MTVSQKIITIAALFVVSAFVMTVIINFSSPKTKEKLPGTTNGDKMNLTACTATETERRFRFFSINLIQ